MEQLLAEIQKFKMWANLIFPDSKPNEICWEWETNYTEWNFIISSFENVIKNNIPDQFTENELCDLVYIIARDNECEILVDILSGYQEWYIAICEMSLKIQEPDARWQLAVYLKRITDNTSTVTLLKKFIEDDNEYVSRRALMELPYHSWTHDLVAHYADLFWNRDIYGEMQEYQRMSVLNVLEKTNSPLLIEYLKKAQEDGRQYLVACANEILFRCAN